MKACMQTSETRLTLLWFRCLETTWQLQLNNWHLGNFSWRRTHTWYLMSTFHSMKWRCLLITALIQHVKAHEIDPQVDVSISQVYLLHRMKELLVEICAPLFNELWIFPEPSVLCDGILERWRSHVPHPTRQTIWSRSSSLLCRRDHFWTAISARPCSYIQVEPLYNAIHF